MIGSFHFDTLVFFQMCFIIRSISESDCSLLFITLSTHNNLTISQINYKYLCNPINTLTEQSYR